MPISVEIIGCCYLAILYLNVVARERSLICLIFTETITPGVLGFKRGMKRLVSDLLSQVFCSRQCSSRKIKHWCLFDGLPGGHILGNIS